MSSWARKPIGSIMGVVVVVVVVVVVASLDDTEIP
jgi:hypothetical protein